MSQKRCNLNVIFLFLLQSKSIIYRDKINRESIKLFDSMAEINSSPFSRLTRYGNRSISVNKMVSLFLSLLLLLTSLGPVKCCGDSGSRNILEERDWAEAPLREPHNVRSRLRRSTEYSANRKACGKDNAEQVPIIRYL